MGPCSISKKEIILGGLDCAHCAEVINDKVSKLEEIEVPPPLYPPEHSAPNKGFGPGKVQSPPAPPTSK